FFFFSSRRRHTRSKRDWSSDVCSSDLGRREDAGVGRDQPRGQAGRAALRRGGQRGVYIHGLQHIPRVLRGRARHRARGHGGRQQIGRASCRGTGNGTGGEVREQKKRRV